jgi:hypothetical protein
MGSKRKKAVGQYLFIMLSLPGERKEQSKDQSTMMAEVIGLPNAGIG